ncbi:hypothetical protein IGI04_014927 [Brassica rapa subsp. trilocularis]|uniref:Uncharacterized protein n=1 Tax=Brassica rapa subsp. trilocularis TaxID=1813537 RepID=A0ABQ7MNN1_BRACM|nr:hypothetical protein IGI04_014927 [Brassica rapa subsp. trilocularis]
MLSFSDVFGQIRIVQDSDLNNLRNELIVFFLKLKYSPIPVPLLYLCHGTRVDSIEGIKKKELMSIGDLHTFIFNSNSDGQQVQIVGVLQQNGWACVSSNMTGHQSSSSDPAPVMDMESGQATESASNLGDVPNIPLGVAEASLTGSAGDGTPANASLIDCRKVV